MRLSFSKTKLYSLIYEIFSSDIGPGVNILYCSRWTLRRVDKAFNIETNGVYCSPRPGGDILFPKRKGRSTICIYKGLPNYVECNTLLHEYGHHLCFSRKCKCLRQRQRHGSEFHALKYTLKELLTRKWHSPLFHEMTLVCTYLSRSDNYLYHASRRLIRDPIWKKCEELFGDELRKWMYNQYGIAKYAMPEFAEAQGEFENIPLLD
ncbi:hypothetical protein LCGC14_0932850 [marine sediment metagenome]|uniref:Uncharacterized protein n=1 Tax=marine sediment metagenome TaxID=412755 RepID=A0A0F9RTZ1_9ZZZZ